MVDDGRRTDGRTNDGRTPDHGHPISSPCEPDGSGELIKIHKCVKITLFKNYHAYFNIFLSNKQVSEYFNALTMQTWKFIY